MTDRDALRPILLFGLSANPPTGEGGHEGIVRWAARGGISAWSDRGLAEIWVLPVYVHAFAQKRDMPAFHHRLEMARLAFERMSDTQVPVRVLDVERTVAQAWARREPLGAGPEGTAGTRPGTIDVVRYLIATHPDCCFGLLLGADTYRDLMAGRWKESQALLQLVEVFVVPRVGIDAIPRKKGGEDAVREAPLLSDISSSILRATTDEAMWRRSVSPEVFAYVVKHGLYGFG